MKRYYSRIYYVVTEANGYDFPSCAVFLHDVKEEGAPWAAQKAAEILARTDKGRTFVIESVETAKENF